jgi:hypothetical protein
MGAVPDAGFEPGGTVTVPEIVALAVAGVMVTPARLKVMLLVV